MAILRFYWEKYRVDEKSWKRVAESNLDWCCDVDTILAFIKALVMTIFFWSQYSKARFRWIKSVKVPMQFCSSWSWSQIDQTFDGRKSCLSFHFINKVKWHIYQRFLTKLRQFQMHYSPKWVQHLQDLRKYQTTKPCARTLGDEKFNEVFWGYLKAFCSSTFFI